MFNDLYIPLNFMFNVHKTNGDINAVAVLIWAMLAITTIYAMIEIAANINHD